MSGEDESGRAHAIAGLLADAWPEDVLIVLDDIHVLRQGDSAVQLLEALSLQLPPTAAEGDAMRLDPDVLPVDVVAFSPTRGPDSLRHNGTRLKRSHCWRPPSPRITVTSWRRTRTRTGPGASGKKRG